MMFKIAFRSISRNARRSLTTASTIGVGAAAMLIFAAYALYDVDVLETTAIERGGHLTVFRQGYSDFGSGDPAIGALLKILYYRNFVVRNGRNQPAQSVIIDAVDRTLVTTADFGALQLQDLPDVWFTRDYLSHLKLK